METDWQPENDPRVKLIADKLREWITLEVAIELLATYMVVATDDAAALQEMSEIVDELGGLAKTSGTKQLQSMYSARSANQLAIAALERINKTDVELSNRGKAAANARHNRPGESREKQRAIRAIWASGKYSSRDLCAEQECAALDMAPGTARRALRNTPEPPRRCAE